MMMLQVALQLGVERIRDGQHAGDAGHHLRRRSGDQMAGDDRDPLPARQGRIVDE